MAKFRSTLGQFLIAISIFFQHWTCTGKQIETQDFLEHTCSYSVFVFAFKTQGFRSKITYRHYATLYSGCCAISGLALSALCE